MDIVPIVDAVGLIWTVAGLVYFFVFDRLSFWPAKIFHSVLWLIGPFAVWSALLNYQSDGVTFSVSLDFFMTIAIISWIVSLWPYAGDYEDEEELDQDSFEDDSNQAQEVK